MQIPPDHSGNYNPKTVCLRQGGKVEVNGVDQTNKLPMNLMADYMQIRRIGRSALMTSFGNGMQIVYDGSSYAYIDAPGSQSNRTAGLCGNFDGNPDNDLTTPNGQLQHSPEAFGHAWRVNDNVPQMNGDVQNPCQTSGNLEQAQEVCYQLTNTVFASCSSDVDPRPYIENCMYDICSSRGDFDPSMCTIFSAYANECSRKGKPIKWREVFTQCGNVI